MAKSKKDQALMDEMSIVDIFTKLIFDSQSALDDSEVQVLELLAHYDETLLKASRRDLSEYLRAMGVDEIILLTDRKFAGADTWATSLTLAGAIKKMEDVDLIFFGQQEFTGLTAAHNFRQKKGAPALGNQAELEAGILKQGCLP